MLRVAGYGHSPKLITMPESRKRHKRVRSICTNCKGEFMHTGHEPRKFCSVSCYRTNHDNKRSRKTILHICQYCRKEYKRKSPRHIYCTEKCGQQARIHGKTMQCYTCGVDVYVYPNKLRGNQKHYCSRACFLITKPEEVSARLNKNSNYWRNLIKNTSCGCGESRTYLLQVHHKDSDRTNNQDANLEILCSNCHITRHLRLNRRGEWIYDPHVLTDPSLLNTLQ